MPVPSVRTIDQDTVRNFGKIQADYEITDLTRIQTESYSRFLQVERSSRDRLEQGLDSARSLSNRKLRWAIPFGICSLRTRQASLHAA
jgi:DNA-directed RNA polymerase beta subunit